MPKDSVLPYLWMFCGTFFFATMGTLAHAAGEYHDWQIVAIARALVALIFVAGLATASGARLVFWKPGMLWVRSIAGSMSLVAGFYSVTHLPVGESLTLTNMFPIWVALLSWPLAGIRPTWEVWVAVTISVVGVALIQQPKVSSGNMVWIAAIASSMFSAVALLGLHRLHALDARAVVAHFSLVSLAFTIVTLFVFPRSDVPTVFTTRSLLLLIGMGMSATVGQILLTKAFTLGNPAKVSVVNLCQVVIGVVYDMTLWGRQYSPLALLGIVLVIAPSAWLLLNRNKSP